MVWPFNRTPDRRTVDTSRTWLVAGGQVRAVQSDTDLLELLGLVSGADGLPSSLRLRAESYSPSAACLRIIPTLAASAPVHLYRRTEGGSRERERDHAIEVLLGRHGFANPWTPANRLIRDMVQTALVDGEAFARVIRAGRPRTIREVQILEKATVEYDAATQEPTYRITLKNGRQEVLGFTDVLHIKAPAGCSPVKNASRAIELGLHLERTAIALFKSDGRPACLLKFKGRVDPEAANKAADQWLEDVKDGRPGVLGGDVEYIPLTMKAQVLEIARHFGLSPTLLAELADASLNNSEALGKQTVQFTIGPWLSEISGAISRCMLTPEERKTLYVEHETAALTSADAKSTAEALRLLVGGPIATPNDGRARLNMPKIDGADALYPVQGASPNATGNSAPAA